MVAVSLLVATLTVAASPTEENDRARRRLAHEVDQALLYVEMKLPERAREQLAKLVSGSPGETDALAWLALARAHYAERNLDEAGRAVRRAQGLGLTDRLSEKAWAGAFLTQFQDNVGGLRVRGNACSHIQFSAGLAVPVVDRERRALLEAVPGWRTKSLTRPANTLFFLPKGEYKLGEARIRIIPGDDTSVAAEEIKATCVEPPPTPAPMAQAAVTTPPTPQTPQTPSVTPPTEVTESTIGSTDDILSNPWLWIAVGAAVVAGGAAAAVMVASKGDDGQGGFRQVF